MSADDKNIGRTIAERYRLDELLGRGGYGSVYRGWDIQFARHVAVKLLDASSGVRTPEQVDRLRQRFRLEATAAGRINHRCVVTIYDFGVPDGGDAYIVMELLEGHDLAWELDNRGPLMPDRALRLFGPMLEALGRGHELGIVHKDLKPQNIFIRDAGTDQESMCLVDFGVARVVHEDKLTMTGLIVGTPQYLPPEYITETLVTPKLDVYQVGLILVETLTGIPAIPHGESFIKSCNRHFTGELEIPDEMMAGPLGEVLRGALDPIHETRIADGHELRARLAQIDPASIAFDFQETMKFDRVDPDGRERGTLPMNPPLHPEQASVEIRRSARDSSANIVAGTPAETPANAAAQPVGPATERMDAPAFDFPDEPTQRDTITAETTSDAETSSPAVNVPAGAPGVRVPGNQVRADLSARGSRSPEADRAGGLDSGDQAARPLAGSVSDGAPGAVATSLRPPMRIDPTESVTELPQAEEPKSRGLLIGISLLLFVGVAAGFFALIVALGDTALEAEAVPSAGEPIDASVGDPEPAVPVEVMVIVTDPPDASVFIDGELRGATPFAYELGPNPGREAVVKRDGYESVLVGIAPGEIELDLVATDDDVVEADEPQTGREASKPKPNRREKRPRRRRKVVTDTSDRAAIEAPAEAPAAEPEPVADRSQQPESTERPATKPTKWNSSVDSPATHR